MSKVHRSGQWVNSTRASRLPDDWDRRRSIVLSRDSNTCYLCADFGDEVDHVKPGDDHSLANLACVCHECHLVKTAAEGNAAWKAKASKAYAPRELHPGLIPSE